MKNKSSSNTVSIPQRVSLTQRESVYGHKGLVVWLTGLPGSGKSTIAATLEKELVSRNFYAFLLDGDNIRQGLNKDLGFSSEDRSENIRRIGEVAKLFMESGTVVIVSFISPYRADRERVRETIGRNKFIEVFIDCSLSECERRDPKGLYAKARTGEIPDFTGISAPYEHPLNPEIRLKTDRDSVEECVKQICDYLETEGDLPSIL